MVEAALSAFAPNCMLVLRAFVVLVAAVAYVFASCAAIGSARSSRAPWVAPTAILVFRRPRSFIIPRARAAACCIRGESSLMMFLT